MSDSTNKRTNALGFVAVLMLSAATMLWLFWHHPVTTSIVTIVVLAAFAICARLAQMVETDMSDMKNQNRAGF